MYLGVQTLKKKSNNIPFSLIYIKVLKHVAYK